MRKTIFIILSLVATVTTLSAATPDFAYPQTVIADCEKRLSSLDGATGQKADISRAECLLDIVYARGLVDMQNYFTAPALVDSVARQITDPAVRALVRLIDADIYSSIYNASAYRYDQVKTPDQPLPADISEWNGRQFRAVIDSLVNEAVALDSVAGRQPLADFSAVITADAAARYLYPTVYDFIALKASGLTQNGDAAVPMRLALARSPRRSAPWFNWQVKIINKTEYRGPQIRYAYIDDVMSDKNDESKLEKLYNDNSDCENAGIVLLEIVRQLNSYDLEKKDIAKIDSLRTFVEKFPTFIFINDLKNNLSDLSASRVRFTQNRFAGLNVPTEVKLTYFFTNYAGVVVYKLPKDYNLRNYTKSSLKRHEIMRKGVDVDGLNNIGDTTITVVFTEPGQYQICPIYAPGMDLKDEQVSEMTIGVTPFIPVAVSGSSYDMMFMSYADGAPVSNVSAYVKKKNSRPTLFGVSDANGMICADKAKVAKNKGSFEYYIKDGFKYDYLGGLFPFINERESDNLACRRLAAIFTDRTLYHAGDSVRWEIIVYDAGTALKGKDRVSASSYAKIELRDTNYQLVDSATVLTDEYGRASGCFYIETGKLSGSYTFEVSEKVTETGYTRRLGNTSITVSDFKLNTFKVEITDVKRDYPAKGDVSLSGNATTYAGMPVAAANVSADVYAYRSFFNPEGGGSVAALSATTDNSGNFTIIVPDSVLVKNDSKLYNCEINVTTGAGEGVHISKYFSVGKPYFIMASKRMKYNTDSVPAIDLKVVDANGKNVGIPLNWKICDVKDKDKAIISGSFVSDSTARLDLRGVASGLYLFIVEPADSLLADKSASLMELYSLSKNTMPKNKNNIFFFPGSSYNVKTDADGACDILIGIETSEGAYVYTVLSDGSESADIKLNKLSAGFHHLKFKIRDEVDKAQYCIVAVKNGVTYTAEINVERPAKPRAVISTVSFRDRLTSGSKETWTFTFSKDHKAEAAAMVATMYNASTDMLWPSNWPSNIYFYENTSKAYVERILSSGYQIQATKRYKLLEWVDVSVPDFTPELSYSMVMMGRRRMYKASARSAGTMVGSADFNEVETVEDLAVAPAEEKVYNMAMVESPSAETGMEYDEINRTSKSDNFEYREGEVLQAFWKPDLTFDAEGNSVISFTVPDANATWSFRAFAWTKDVSTATLFKEIISNKPVMVTPQLPRFLRAGDKARMIANVFNNSDSTITATTVVEIFDTNSGTVTRSVTSTDTIAPMASAPVSIEVAADGNASAIGYRVRSTSGRFSDGEQDYIAVMPSTSDVIESDNFYLNPGESDYSVRLPKGKMESVTLEYNASPAWEVIKQLPALAVCESYTSTGAARRLFGAAVSSGLLKKYPALARAIETWSADSASQALVSRLSQNEDLKTAALTETPWVQAAQSDSERMARLVALLDSKAVSRNMAASIAKLKSLKAADGGWRWGEWESKGNAWSTRSTLYSLGQLNAIGMMPADKELKAMIESAFAFLDSKTTKIYPDLALSATLAMFPDHELSLRERQIVNATTAYINKEYRKFGTAEKARAAIVLDAFGYKAMARQLMESVAQFGVSSKDKGMSFPSVTNVDSYADLLFAFARIEPQSSAIDGMRQWLVVRGQATSRLGSFDPTRLIAAFEMTGSDWNVSGAAPVVTLGGEAVSVGSVEPVTGHLIAQLPTDASGKKLAVVRDNAAGPAYGAVISRYISASTDVKAVKCDGLSIEKRLTVQRGDRWEYADSLRLGDRVRVLLTIKADRDLEYVTVIDERPASFEPVNQLPGYVYSAGLGFYRENNDTDTRLFVGYMPKGTYQITTEMTVGFAGEFTSGIATAQSSLDPAITAHSSGRSLICR